MTSTLAILGCLLAAVEISVSPDQPLGFSYTDDPLILEVRSDEPLTADLEVTLSPPVGGASVRRRFPETTFGPGINRWCAVKELPAARGPWLVNVTVRSDRRESSQETVVYRIDRPAGAYRHPLFAHGNALDRNTLLALRSVAVEQVRVPVAHPELKKLLEDAEALGMKAIIVLDSASDVAAGALAATSCDAIARWELNAADEDPAALASAIEAVQALPCSLPISLGIRDEAPVLALRELGAAGKIEHLVVYESEAGPAALDTIRKALASPGDESPELEYLFESDRPGGLLAGYFEARAHGAARVGFPARLVATPEGLQPDLASLNGLVHGVPPAGFAGSLPGKSGVRAFVFSVGEQWTMAFWGESDAATLSVPWSADAPVTMYDGWNNPLEIEAPEEGETWACPVSTGVQLLQGAEGPILKAALIGEVESKAKALLARRDLAPAWSESAQSTLEAVRAEPISNQSRVHFFALLRAFPDIEEHWHAGEITRPAAVAALAGLADLARTLCKLEAARGATFLEPIQDTLARCEEYQSRYLTGSTSTPQARARGDWLVEEVRRLMDEVESLLAAGAKIEADAVAALAEWRARGLEFAAKAGPQSDRMSIPAPEEKPEEKPEGNTKGKK